MANIKRVLFSEEEHDEVLRHFQSSLLIPPEIQPNLRDVLTDSLSHPGSLIRGQLAYKLMTSFDASPSDAKNVSIALEYFHLASLIFDDLTCMDNAFHRRGNVCVHAKYGESAAILGALAFVNRAYTLILGQKMALAQRNQDSVGRILDECLGPAGILNGQARDLSYSLGEKSAEAITNIAKGKTVSLIRLSMVLPALLVGASPRETHQLNRLSLFVGLAYQLLDDFKDLISNFHESGKSTGRDADLSRPNYVLFSGQNESLKRLLVFDRLAKKSVHRLNTFNSKWSFLFEFERFLYAEIQKVEFFFEQTLPKVGNQ